MSVQLESVRLERESSVAILTLNRPQRLNAMNRAMLREISAALNQIEGDPNVRSVVVCGEGPSFSSGFDLKEQMEARPAGTRDWKRVLDEDFRVVMRFWSCPKPTVAAVWGHCLAGGCELAMSCDVTVAEENAVFGEPELKFGAGIVVMLLPWLVGPKLAKEIILTGQDKISAEEARRIGLVNRVVPPGAGLETALALARNMATIDPMLMRETKRAINRTYEIMGLAHALESALDIDLRIEGEGSPDKLQFMEIAREQGLRAAIAWRDARFTVVEGTHGQSIGPGAQGSERTVLAEPSGG